MITIVGLKRDGFQGIFRGLVRSSEDAGTSDTVKTQENDCLTRSDFATKVKGKNSSLCNRAIIDKGFYKAAIVTTTVHVRNSYYQKLPKVALNYITIAINNAMVFKVYATHVTATYAAQDDFD